MQQHMINMATKGRRREDSYTKILSSDSSDSGVSSGVRKFFGLGGNGKK